MPPRSEKERVYAELHALQRRVAAQREEINNLRAATDAKENAVLRREATSYRAALSNIAYRLTNGGIEEATLREIVESALLLRGLKTWRREEILKLWDVRPALPEGRRSTRSQGRAA